MNKLLSVFLILLATISLVSLWITMGYVLYTFGDPVKVLEISSGKAGNFIVGETKESLLSRLPDETYTPEPKPAECPANWIEPKSMTSVQKQCLLTNDEWEVGNGIQELCPEHTDFHATLFFSNNIMAKVKIRCTRPE